MHALILTYHSHHMAGSGYASNDHVALAADLRTIDRAGFRIVALAEMVDRLLAIQRGEPADDDATRVVALTFDDGPEYDAVDYLHPTLGLQRSFLSILQEFAASADDAQQSRVCATSFVIASPDARLCMETATDAGPYYLHRGAMNEDWWPAAIDSGRIAIANHSWDHLHPALATVAHSRGARADFTQVDNPQDAAAQVEAAARYIDERTGGRASPFFAYPFGQYNRYLVEDYFPRHESPRGAVAAFTVDGRPLRPSENRWALPRYSCGYNWNTPEELTALLNQA